MSSLWRHPKYLSSLAYGTRLGSLALIVLALFLTAACGNASAQAAATQILDHIQKSNITDVTLELAETYTDQGKTVATSGPMKFTQNPARYDATLTILVGNNHAVVEEIGDIAGGVVYAKAISPQESTMWKKFDISSNYFSYEQVFCFESLANAELVDTETLEGAPVWHVRGDLIGGNVNSKCDLYVRQDTYRPVKVVTVTTGSVPVKDTLRYTAFNSGFSIDLPPDDQVQ
jgi:hypothetical protein